MFKLEHYYLRSTTKVYYITEYSVSGGRSGGPEIFAVHQCIPITPQLLYTSKLAHNSLMNY